MRLGEWPREMRRFFLMPERPPDTLDLASSDGVKPHLFFAWGCFRNFESRLSLHRVRGTTANASRRGEAIQRQAIVLRA
jgi:hypothetical protein